MHDGCNFTSFFILKPSSTRRLRREAGDERGSFFFFRLQEYKRLGISLVEVYERVGKSVISICKNAQRAN